MKFLYDNMDLLAMIVVGFTLWGSFVNILDKCNPPTYGDEIAEACAKFVFILLIFIALSVYIVQTN